MFAATILPLCSISFETDAEGALQGQCFEICETRNVVGLVLRENEHSKFWRRPLCESLTRRQFETGSELESERERERERKRNMYIVELMAAESREK